MDDFTATYAKSRHFNPENAIQARSWFGELASVLEKFVLRDATPDELDNTQESGPGQDIHARSILAGMLARLMNIFGFRIQLRDVTPETFA